MSQSTTRTNTNVVTHTVTHPDFWMETFTGKKFYFTPHLTSREADNELAINLSDIAHSLAIQNRFRGHTAYPWSVASHSLLVHSILTENPDIFWLYGLKLCCGGKYGNDVKNEPQLMLGNFTKPRTIPDKDNADGDGPLIVYSPEISIETRLLALVHDAHEAYSGDSILPHKQAEKYLFGRFEEGIVYKMRLPEYEFNSEQIHQIADEAVMSHFNLTAFSHLPLARDLVHVADQIALFSEANALMYSKGCDWIPSELYRSFCEFIEVWGIVDQKLLFLSTTPYKLSRAYTEVKAAMRSFFKLAFDEQDPLVASNSYTEKQKSKATQAGVYKIANRHYEDVERQYLEKFEKGMF